MEDTINVKYFKRKCKIERFKRKVKEKVHNTIVWIDNNKEYLVIIVPAVASVVGGIVKIGKSISKNIALEQEKKMKDTRIYDRSLGKYIELKRPLNNKDMQIILERKDSGEKLSSILMDLDLIK